MNTLDVLPETVAPETGIDSLGAREDDALDRALAESFPASDAPSATAPTRRIGAPAYRAGGRPRAAHRSWIVTAENDGLPARMARERLLAHLGEGSAGERRQAIDSLVAMLASPDARLRRQGYALFRDGLEDALFQSCLNYGALVHGFTHPLLSVLEEAVERWAAAAERPVS